MEGRCTWRKGKDMLINWPNIQDAVSLSYELLALKITFSTTPNSSTVNFGMLGQLSPKSSFQLIR